jgi:hypothetical protein
MIDILFLKIDIIAQNHGNACNSWFWTPLLAIASGISVQWTKFRPVTGLWTRENNRVSYLNPNGKLKWPKKIVKYMYAYRVHVPQFYLTKMGILKMMWRFSATCTQNAAALCDPKENQLLKWFAKKVQEPAIRVHLLMNYSQTTLKHEMQVNCEEFITSAKNPCVNLGKMLLYGQISVP